ncbi:MAG: DUF2156 domain-containing protein [Akkermansia sp.]|nr:DUF2156 domain-containing protein [Akkermansia sp.]
MDCSFSQAAPLPFAAPTLSDAQQVRKIVTAAQASGNDLAFANIYLLREKYKTSLAIKDGFFFRHYAGNTRLQGYAFPCGTGDVAAALQCIEADAAARQRKLCFCLLTEQEAATLQALRPGVYHFACDPGNADYLYRQSDLATLPGTAYHRKRNHIARFCKQYPQWSFCPLSRELADHALQVATAWYEGQENTPALQHELHAIHAALQHMDELHLCGGIIYVNERPVAMSIASLISPEVADVHYEKCSPDFRDAYPIINQEMARALPCHIINREEDLNQPGLRQAKLSYRPCSLLQKFTATPITPTC